MHMAQLMPLPLTVSCFSKSRLVLPFWYRPTWLVPEKGPLNGCVCVCVIVDKTQVQVERKNGKYGWQRMFTHISVSWLGAHAESGSSSPQIFHFNHWPGLSLRFTSLTRGNDSCRRHRIYDYSRGHCLLPSNRHAAGDKKHRCMCMRLGLRTLDNNPSSPVSLSRNEKCWSSELYSAFI